MAVHVEIERAAEALDQRHCADLRGCLANPSLLDQKVRNRAVDEPFRWTYAGRPLQV